MRRLPKRGRAELWFYLGIPVPVDFIALAVSPAPLFKQVNSKSLRNPSEPLKENLQTEN